jgi:hypothetical protein
MTAHPEGKETVQEAQGYQALWSQVVLQAKDDVETSLFGSVEYQQAADFFVGTGNWAEARTSIAEMVDLHPDDLTRLGRQLINLRRDQEGLPPLIINQTPVMAALPIPLPVLFATMPPPPSPRESQPSARHRHIYGGAGRINPFSRFRHA